MRRGRGGGRSGTGRLQQGEWGEEGERRGSLWNRPTATGDRTGVRRGERMGRSGTGRLQQGEWGEEGERRGVALERADCNRGSGVRRGRGGGRSVTG